MHKKFIYTVCLGFILSTASYAATNDNNVTETKTVHEQNVSSTTTELTKPPHQTNEGSMSSPMLKTTNQSTLANVDRNKQNARTWYEEIVLKNNQQPIDLILSKDVVVEFAPSFKSPTNGSNKVMGIDQVKKHIAKVNEDYKMSGNVIYLIGEGNKVALYRVVNTKLPNGKSADVPWATFFEFDDDGKINKMTHVHDTLYAQQQLQGVNIDTAKRIG